MGKPLATDTVGESNGTVGILAMVLLQKIVR